MHSTSILQIEQKTAGCVKGECLGDEYQSQDDIYWGQSAYYADSDNTSIENHR